MPESRPTSDCQTTQDELRSFVNDFVERRDWRQFHSPKNLSMALAIEVTELMEHFQWLTIEQSRQVAEQPERLALEPEEKINFVELCHLLNVTDGNLGAHLQKLESEGYLALEKCLSPANHAPTPK